MAAGESSKANRMQLRKQIKTHLNNYFAVEKLSKSVFSILRLPMVTSLQRIGGGASALSVTFVLPGLEQLFEHCWLAPLTHHLHPGVGWIVLGFNKALGGGQGGQERVIQKKHWHGSQIFTGDPPELCWKLPVAPPWRLFFPSTPSHWSLCGPKYNSPDQELKID